MRDYFRRFPRFFLLGSLLVLLGLAGGTAAAQSGGIVREIVVEGAERIEPDTVRSYLLVQEGDPFDARRIDRSLKSLFATGLFADVNLKRRGDTLIVTVIENPIINRIAFEGNRRIEDEELEAEVTLRPRIIYTRTKVQNDVERLLTLYRRSGRFAATVEPKIIRLEQNRVDLVFEISEGDVTAIQKIRFIGNREFSDSRLREVIRTKETRWYRFFSTDDTYDPDRLTLDRELMRRFYLNEGFADFRVVSAVAELTPDRSDFFITFTMEEGPIYEFGTVDVEVTLRDLEQEPLLDVIEFEEGDTYNADIIENTIDTLTDAVGTLGHAFVDVRPRINRDRERKAIDVTFEVSEGPRVFVERIDIAGNIRTMDEVIRREFRLVEGDAFNSARLRRSRTRVQDLDFFEKVNVEQVPGSAPDKTVIKVEVEEKSTGSLSLGAGFSTASGALFDIGIRERNLLGRGQDLRLNGQVGQRRSQIDLSFTEPYFLDREVAAGFDLFFVSTDFQDESSFDSKRRGGAVRAGYPITENLSQGWRYSLKQLDVANVDDQASVFIRQSEGERFVSEVSHSLTYDRRDSRINPKQGYFVRMSNDLAGAGGDTRYLRNRLDGGKFFPLGPEWVLSLTGSTGHITGISQDVRLLDRFFIGGDDLRGFATAGVGPRDRTTKDALGSELMYTAKAELQFPLGLPTEIGITGKLFTDLGSSWQVTPDSPLIQDSSNPRVSVGTGLAWVSPFGPIGVDFGIPVIKEDFDEDELIRINFGTRF